MKPETPVAIVGIGGIFPDAPTLDQFWKNIEDAHCASREVPAGRWPLKLEEMFDPTRGTYDKVYSKRGCYITDFDFEPEGLNIEPALLEQLDPVFLLALHAARDAVRDAKIEHVDHCRTGVILGCIALPTEKTSAITTDILGRTFEEKVLTLGARTSLSATVADRDVRAPSTHPINRYAVGMIAGMVAKALNLGGGSFTVDGACAASLYAVNYAVMELQAGRADLMLTGGACRPDSAFTQMGFCQLGALSPTGFCSPFDTKGNGLVVGEGAGIFVLKRLDDALRDQDHIYAVIRGIGLSNDRQGNLLAPDAEGQVRAMQTAYRKAGWSPQDVDLIECHATGTPVGDVVEFNSLKTLWGEKGWQPNQCVIGGVKSNVGHLLTGAGAAGLMKTVLALKQKTLPPTANFVEPDPRLDIETSPFTVLQQARSWETRDNDTPRRAAVSAFGFGGINAHVLLEEWQQQGSHQSEERIHLTSEHAQQQEPIAIIGMGAHFGPWDSLRAFQERVLGGGDTVEPQAKTRWWGVERSQWYQNSELNTASFKGYFIDQLAIPFGKFKIPPIEMQESLPQQLVMLQVAAAALEDAKVELNDETALKTGVYVGIGLDLNSTNYSYRWRIAKKAKEWAAALQLNLSEKELQEWVQSLRDTYGPPLTANRTVGSLGGIVASRVAREFKIGGAGITVSGEESSGFIALNVAVRSLQQGDIDQAIVGAVDLNGDVRSLLMTHAERPFSEDGNLPGEGAAAVILKRLKDAERDGNRIYGVIKGLGVASGQQQDRVVLSAQAYRHALERAYQDAGIAPASIQYLETNRSGHQSEDQVEFETLVEFFDKKFHKPNLSADAEFFDKKFHKPNSARLNFEPGIFTPGIGSVKADIGHTGAASGLASLVKACLCLHQEIIPAVRNAESFSDESSPFTVPTGSQYWIRNRTEGPRRAGVSCVGIEGNCVHVVLEGYEKIGETTSERLQPLGARTEALFAFEADSEEILFTSGQELRSLTADHASSHIEMLARSWWQQHPLKGDKRLTAALLARDQDELLSQLGMLQQAVQSGDTGNFPGNRIFYSAEPLGQTGELAFVFPGSGNHYSGMGRAVSALWPEILRVQDRQNQYVRSQYLPEILWNQPSVDEIGCSAREILLGQVSYSTMMAEVLQQLGVRPQVSIGDSLGESSAFFALRAWNDRDEMLRRIMTWPLYSRDLAGEFLAASQTWNLEEGTSTDWMVVVLQVSAEAVHPILESQERVYLLIINTAESCVIGGERQAVTAVLQKLGCGYHELSGVSAAHCEVVKQVQEAYRGLHHFESTVAPKGIRFYSAAWGKSFEVTPDSAADAILAQGLQTIDFPAVIRQAYQDGVRVFVEIGPGNSCSNMIAKILKGQPHVAVSACAVNYEDVSTILRLLGRLIAEHVPVDLSQLYGQKTQVVAHQAATYAVPAKAIRLDIGGQPFQIQLPQPKAQFTSERAESAENVKNMKQNISTPIIESPPALNARTSLSASAVPENSHAQNLSPSSIPLEFSGTAGAMTELIKGVSDSFSKQVQAHEAYLKLAQGLTQSYADQVAFQMSLLESMRPDDQSSGSKLKYAEAHSQIFMNREQCLEFAVGSIAKVLGEAFAEADTYPTRVRLPDEPLMLVDRIIEVEGEPRSMTHGKVITEHDIFPGDWYLDCNRIPVCIAVESGQADLFLSGYLGIDLETKGLAVYRLLDADVTFHGALPGPGTVLRYDIYIDEFFRQGATYLFRFRFDCTADGELFLTMSKGCAGFFTQKELDGGQGLVFTKMDLQPMPGKLPANWQPLVNIETRESYTDAQVDALRNGDLVACFGSQFANLPLQHPAILPGGLMRLVHRVLRLDPKGGRYGLGQICGEADIHPNDWFLTCHFVDDMVMPGTLMYECCLHTLRILLMRMGWVGEQPEIAWEPVPGVAGQLKCRGQVIATTKTVQYEVTIKEIGFRPEPYVITDAVMSADQKPVVRMIDMSLQLTGMTREKLEAIWQKKELPTPIPSQEGNLTRSHALRGNENADRDVRAPKPAMFDSKTIMAFSNGKPSEAFGERYRTFDEERVIARLPGPPYQFLDRITAVQGEQWVMTSGKTCEAQYDVPPEEWYFASNCHQNMPFSILLEIVLQPCGWLAAYVGSALTSEIDLSFRNLGGKATQYANITPHTGTLTTQVALTGVSTSGGMIIQHYDYELTDAAGHTLYKGNTYFGFFTKQALANQIGIRDADVYQPTAEETARGKAFPYPQDAPFPDTQMRMVDTIDLFVADGGPHKRGFIRGLKTVNPAEWFFQAHFYQDPVWPGSLGLEAFLQLLKVVAVTRWGWQPQNRFETMAMNRPHEWIYRGQVIPKDRQVTIQAVITAIDDEQRLIEAEGFLLVDGRIIYQMDHFTLRITG